jgi:hypothetical protein
VDVGGGHVGLGCAEVVIAAVIGLDHEGGRAVGGDVLHEVVVVDEDGATAVRRGGGAVDNEAEVGRAAPSGAVVFGGEGDLACARGRA